MTKVSLSKAMKIVGVENVLTFDQVESYVQHPFSTAQKLEEKMFDEESVRVAAEEPCYLFPYPSLCPYDIRAKFPRLFHNFGNDWRQDECFSTRRPECWCLVRKNYFSINQKRNNKIYQDERELKMASIAGLDTLLPFLIILNAQEMKHKDGFIRSSDTKYLYEPRGSRIGGTGNISYPHPYEVGWFGGQMKLELRNRNERDSLGFLCEFWV